MTKNKFTQKVKVASLFLGVIALSAISFENLKAEGPGYCAVMEDFTCISGDLHLIDMTFRPIDPQ